MLHIEHEVPQKIADIIRDGYSKVNALWPISQNVTFTLMSGKSRNGYCHKITDSNFIIGINRDLVKEENILEVVVHELLHSYPVCFNYKDSKGRNKPHGGEWKRRGEIISKTYGIKVSRCNTFERSQTYATRQIRYRFECSCCHQTWNYARAPRWINLIEKAKCPYCHTNTIIQTSGQTSVRKIL